MAGLATGLWKDKKEISQKWKKNREFKPMIDKEKREKLYKDWKKQLNDP